MTFASWPYVPPPPDAPSWPDRPAYPYPPARPTPVRRDPVMVPMVDVPDGAATTRLRRVTISGSLDHETATRVAAELMELDGRSADAVELVINSDGGPLAELPALLDVIAAMRARVDTRCLGRALGTAAVLLACGTGVRRAGDHATITLRCTHPEAIEGPVDGLRQQLDDLERVRGALLAALAVATKQPVAVLREHLDHGPPLDHAQATAFGLLDA